MAALTSFHAEKCCRLVSAHTASDAAYAAIYSSIRRLLPSNSVYFAFLDIGRIKGSYFCLYPSAWAVLGCMH